MPPRRRGTPARRRPAILAPVLACVLAAAGARATRAKAQDAVQLAALLGDRAVLPRAPEKAHVFGEAAPHAEVHVALDGRTVATAVADEQGRFSVRLPPQPASGKPRTLSASSEGLGTAVAHDVLFGEVWACSGQSNMAFVVSQADNATVELERARQYPLIRVATVGITSLPGNATPPYDPPAIAQQWTAASDGGIAGDAWATFSATCWYFGRDVFERLGGNVPVGLIVASVGGTAIELWTPLADQNRCIDAPCFDASRNCAHWAERGECTRNPGYMLHMCKFSCKVCKGPPWVPPAASNGLTFGEARGMLSQYRHSSPAPPKDTHDLRTRATSFDEPAARAAASDTTPMTPTYFAANEASFDGDDRAGLFNGMLAPVLRLSLSGIIWYQGEANYYNPAGRTPDVGYRCLFPAFVNAVRRYNRDTKPNSDANESLPFGFVQLAGYCDVTWKAADCSYASLHLVAEVRWAQVAGLSTAPNPILGDDTFFATAIDLEAPNGTFPGSFGDIHPPDKQHVGSRLALAAMAVAYRNESVRYVGPVLSGCTINESVQGGPVVKLLRTLMAAVKAPVPVPMAQRYLHMEFDDVALKGDSVALRATHGIEVRYDGSDEWRAATLVDAMGSTAHAELPGDHERNAQVVALRYAWRDNPCCPQSYGPTGPPDHYVCEEFSCALYGAESALPAPPFYVAVGSDGKCIVPWGKRDDHVDITSNGRPGADAAKAMMLFTRAAVCVGLLLSAYAWRMGRRGGVPVGMSKRILL